MAAARHRKVTIGYRGRSGGSTGWLTGRLGWASVRCPTPWMTVRRPIFFLATHTDFSPRRLGVHGGRLFKMRGTFFDSGVVVCEGEEEKVVPTRGRDIGVERLTLWEFERRRGAFYL
jgi:hypothetical protein